MAGACGRAWGQGMGEEQAIDAGEEQASVPDITIEADIAGCFTYASFQNAIPVIRSITIANPTATNREGLELRLTSNPPFLRAKTWSIDRILSGDRIAVSDRKIDLDAAYLAGLNEAERGEIERPTEVVGIFPKHDAIGRFVGALLLEQNDEWAVQRSRCRTLETIATMSGDPLIGLPAAS